VVSRYVHLNPVRVRGLDLDKQARAADRMGMGGKPDKALIQERLEYLRAFRWSSFRAYAGWERPPAWLTCQRVLEIGGGKATNPFEQYRDYVEAAVREGLPPSPWEQLVGQLVLGSREFLAQIAQNLGGAGREQPQLKRVRGRPDWQRVVAAIELVRGLTWQDMCRRRGDWGRDLAWYFGRTECGLSLQALGEAAGGVDYSAVSAAVVRLKRKLVHDSELAQQARLVNERIWLES
jgi:hypothetical protein